MSRGLRKINAAWRSNHVGLCLRWNPAPLTVCVSHKVNRLVQSNHLRSSWLSWSVITDRLLSRESPLSGSGAGCDDLLTREIPLLSHSTASTDSSLQCKITFAWLTWNPQSYHLVSLMVLVYQDLNPPIYLIHLLIAQLLFDYEIMDWDIRSLCVAMHTTRHKKKDVITWP